MKGWYEMKRIFFEMIADSRFTDNIDDEIKKLKEDTIKALSGIDATFITYGDASTESISVVSVNETKYTPYRITFINKFGALQSLWMFKKSELALNVESKNYRSYTYASNAYEISSHQYRQLSVSGREEISLNSGFYPETHNEVFKEIVLSEKIWIDYEGNILPINLKSKKLAFKTSLNDKLINYKLDFEFAYDKVNSVY